MLVYDNDFDSVKDFIRTYIQKKSISIDPYCLSEWIYGYVSNQMMEETNPDVLSMIDKAGKLFPDVKPVEVVTILATVIFESYENNYQEWAMMYLQEN